MEIADGQLRFDCSFLWHICVDDSVELKRAETEKGEVWLATAKDNTQNVAAAVDTREHVVLIKNTGPIGQKEWTLRLAPGIQHNGLIGQNGRMVRCEEDSGILALNVEQPSGSTVLLVSKAPFSDADVRAVTFSDFPSDPE